jgi:hypothetical protein
MAVSKRKPYSATEQQLMDALVETAEQLGYKCAHVPDKLYALAGREGRFDAMRGAKGLPDLVIIGFKTMFVIETKSDVGKTDRTQDEWMAAFTEFAAAICPDCAANVHVMVARPEDQDAIMRLMAFHREQSWKELA